MIRLVVIRQAVIRQAGIRQTLLIQAVLRKISCYIKTCLNKVVLYKYFHVGCPNKHWNLVFNLYNFFLGKRSAVCYQAITNNNNRPPSLRIPNFSKFDEYINKFSRITTNTFNFFFLQT